MGKGLRLPQEGLWGILILSPETRPRGSWRKAWHLCGKIFTPHMWMDVQGSRD